MDYRKEAILTAERESELLQEGRREGNESRDPDVDGRDGSRVIVVAAELQIKLPS